MMSLYETDFYAWANEQAALLRSGNLSTAEIDHIAEEIESMGAAKSVNSFLVTKLQLRNPYAEALLQEIACTARLRDPHSSRGREPAVERPD